MTMGRMCRFRSDLGQRHAERTHRAVGVGVLIGLSRRRHRLWRPDERSLRQRRRPRGRVGHARADPRVRCGWRVCGACPRGAKQLASDLEPDNRLGCTPFGSPIGRERVHDLQTTTGDMSRVAGRSTARPRPSSSTSIRTQWASAWTVRRTMPRAWTAALVTSSLTNSSANSMTDPSTRSSARTLPVKTRALRTLAGVPRNSTALAIDFPRTPSTDHLLPSSHAESPAGVAVRALREQLRRAASSVGSVRVRVGRRRCGRVPQGDDVPLARESRPRSPGEPGGTRRALAGRTHLVDLVRRRRLRISPRRPTRRCCRLASSDRLPTARLGRPGGVTQTEAAKAPHITTTSAGDQST